MVKWIQLLIVLGPKISTAMPLILDIVNTLIATRPSKGRVFASAHAKFDEAVTVCCDNGMDRQSAEQLCSQIPVV